MSCRKLTFRTVEAAQRTATLIAGVRGGKTSPARIYRCDECGELHFTSKSEREVGPLASTEAIVSVALCSRPGCPMPSFAQCDDCGAPVCAGHAAIRGSLQKPRYHCGRCDKETDGPVAAPPLPPPVVAAGPFAKLETKPKRQPWVKAEKPAKVLATRVVEMPKPAPKPPKLSGQAKHEADVAKARAAKRAKYESDATWLKDHARLAVAALAEGDVFRAVAIMEAVASLPKGLGADAAGAERWLEKFIAERTAWHTGSFTGDKLRRRFGCGPPAEVEGYPV